MSANHLPERPDRPTVTDTGNPSEPNPAQTWYDLPAAVREPFEVFLNGVPQHPGADYRHIEGTLIFPRALKPELKMTFFQRLLEAIGIGTYHPHDTLDVIYHRDGRRLVATDLQPRQTPQ